MKKIFILTGEPSGDKLASKVISKLQKNNPNIEITHINLNDDTVEGISLKHKNCFSVQYHPESSPGPYDSRYLFDEFVERMMKHKKNG